MIEETGTVVACAGSFARVATQRRSACGGCVAQGACGTSLLERALGRAPVQVHALNQVRAVVGDRVVVGVSEQGLLAGAVALYLVPLLGLIGGLVLGASVAQILMAGAVLSRVDPDLLALAGAAIGFSLALSWLRGYSASLRESEGRQPVILRVLDDPLPVRIGAPSAAPGARP
jgi:sigma-E factor negative regulatory protein RseC